MIHDAAAMTLSRIRIVLEPLLRRCFHRLLAICPRHDVRRARAGVRCGRPRLSGEAQLRRRAGTCRAAASRSARRRSMPCVANSRRRATSSSTVSPCCTASSSTATSRGAIMSSSTSCGHFIRPSKPVPNREIVDCGFFDVKSLPEGTTRGTRRRIEEAVGGRADLARLDVTSAEPVDLARVRC